MHFEIEAEYYFEQDTGIMLYSEVTIYEWMDGNPSYWLNHTFIRQLNEYTDFSEEEEEDDTGFFQMIYDYITNPDNAISITILCLIIGGTVFTLWNIRRRRTLRYYEEYKEILKEEKKIPKKS